MDTRIALALIDKEQARNAREKNPPEAIRLIEQAVTELEQVWEERRVEIDAAGATARPDDRDLVEALSESHGVWGGILRSDERYSAAVKQYERGLFFEQHPARKVDNSYNLVQRLTNCVLVAPERAGAPDWKVDEVDMWEELDRATKELERQTRTSRKGDPWAAADNVILQVLLAPRRAASAPQPIKEALTALEGLRPKPFCYESTLRALRDVEQRLRALPEGKKTEEIRLLSKCLKDVTRELKRCFAKARAR